MPTAVNLTMTDAIIVNRKALAKVLGVSVRHLTNLEANGIIRPVSRKRGAQGSQFDLTQAVPAYVAHVSAQADPGDARRRKDMAAARLAELRYARESGELVARADVVAQMVTFIKALQARLRALPSRALNEGLITRDHAGALRAIIRDHQQEVASWKLADVQRIAQSEDGDDEEVG